MTSEKWITKLGKIPGQPIAALCIIVTVIPLLAPLLLPLPANPLVADFFNTFNSLQPGDRALIISSLNPALGWTEARAYYFALLQHLFKLPGVKWVVVPMQPLALGTLNSFIMPDLAQYGVNPYNKTYGIDYVFMPYTITNEANYDLMGRNFRAFFKVDYRNTPIAQIPAWDGINSIGDFKVVVDAGVIGTVAPKYYLAMIYTRFPNVPYYNIMDAGAVKNSIQYLGAGLKGIIYGLPMTGVYLNLIGGPFPPGFYNKVDATSMYHVLILALIVLGNIPVVYDKVKKRRVK